MNIAFIGIGNMGGPMAINLQKAGHEVQAFDLSAAACATVREAGVAVASSAVEAASKADVVVSMLPASAHVEALYLGKDGQVGLLDILPAGALIIDCSTIAAASAQKVGAAAQAKGYDFIDAPVSGGTAGAAAGTLTFMVGGSEQALGRARPLLEKMGANIFHAGDIGAGQTAKICNNMLLGISMAGTCEAMALGMANGLDPKALAEIMRRSSGGNWVLEKYNPVPGVMDGTPASRNYSGGFATDLMLKDLGLAQENAMQVKASTPLGAMARSLYAAHSLSGKGGLDMSSFLQMLQKS